MPEVSHLSKREQQIMDVIYARGQATATQVLQEIAHPPGRDAVRTFLRILEAKGHLSHSKKGRQFIYRPTHPRGSVGRSALARVLDVFFNGSLEKAVAAHLTDAGRKKPDPAELRRLARLIEQANQDEV